MSRKIPIVCDICDALFYTGKYDETARCPKCGNYVDVMHDGYDDRRYEDDCQ